MLATPPPPLPLPVARSAVIDYYHAHGDRLHQLRLHRTSDNRVDGSTRVRTAATVETDGVVTDRFWTSYYIKVRVTRRADGSLKVRSIGPARSQIADLLPN